MTLDMHQEQADVDNAFLCLKDLCDEYNKSCCAPSFFLDLDYEVSALYNLLSDCGPPAVPVSVAIYSCVCQFYIPLGF